MCAEPGCEAARPLPGKQKHKTKEKYCPLRKFNHLSDPTSGDCWGGYQLTHTQKTPAEKRNATNSSTTYASFAKTVRPPFLPSQSTTKQLTPHRRLLQNPLPPTRPRRNPLHQPSVSPPPSPHHPPNHPSPQTSKTPTTPAANSPSSAAPSPATPPSNPTPAAAAATASPPPPPTPPRKPSPKTTTTPTPTPTLATRSTANPSPNPLPPLLWPPTPPLPPPPVAERPAASRQDSAPSSPTTPRTGTEIETSGSSSRRGDPPAPAPRT